MKKKIKQVGTSIGIYFTKEEAEIFELAVGDIIEVNISK